MGRFYPLLFVALLTGCVGEGMERKPNVLFIAIDDLRPELSCYGKNDIVSPNIDKLADEGVVFTNAYCQQALCGPSRLSVMTGVHPDRVGVYAMSNKNKIEWRDTRKGIVSIPEQFRNYGYYAVGFGKIYDNRLGLDKAYSWDSFTEGWKSMFASPENLEIIKQKKEAQSNGKPVPRDPAFECYDTPDETYTDGANTNSAIGFIHEYSGDQPFFLAVGFSKPHLPFVAPKKYWDMYDPASISLSEYQDYPEGMSKFTLSPYKEIFDYEVASPVSKETALELRHGYYACVSYVDAQIGKLVQALEDKGELDNTIIVLWGDHGFKLGDFGEWAKATNLEIDVQAPLILRLPDKKGSGEANSALVELVDVMPTLCEAAGIPVPESAEGKSLLPVIGKPGKQVRNFALSQYPRGREAMGYSVRTPGWRYTEWINRFTGATIDSELYMIREGSMEIRNVIKEFPNESGEFSRLLHEYLDQAIKWEGTPVTDYGS